MITHERLKELIERESGCYVLNDYITGYIHLKPKYEPETYENGEHNYILYIYCDDKKEYKEEIFDEQLFETKEEAEWAKEFSDITRTERLDLPNWEEVVYYFKVSPIQNFEITFVADSLLYEFAIYDFDIVRIYMKGFSDTSWDIIFEEPLTKENYPLACRKAKELFLGEEKE